MAGAPIVETRQKSDEVFSRTFGPFAAGWADQTLAFMAHRRVVIDKILLLADTKPSVGSNLTMYRQAPTINSTNGGTGSGSLCGEPLTTQTGNADVAAAVTAANKIADAFDLNTLTNLAPTVMPLTTSNGRPTNNILEPGDRIAMDVNTATNMAGLYITITFRSVIN